MEERLLATRPWPRRRAPWSRSAAFKCGPDERSGGTYQKSTPCIGDQSRGTQFIIVFFSLLAGRAEERVRHQPPAGVLQRREHRQGPVEDQEDVERTSR